MRTRAVAVAVLVCICSAACDSEGSHATSTTVTNQKAQARFEAREVLALLPPDTGPHEGAVVLTPGNNHPTTGGLTLPSADGKVRYQVGPVSMTNADIESAKAIEAPGQGWTVDVALNRAGHRHLNELARVLYPKEPPQNEVALVVNGVVQADSAFATPGSFNGDMVVGNNLTEAQAKVLAASLNP
jgi:hypothetical protein